MTRAKPDSSIKRLNLASVVRGLYGRVAEELDVDPSYVSRVARGERQSETVEAALSREMKRILKMVGANHNGANHNGANHNGANYNSQKKSSSKKKRRKVAR
jgi:hypothetical protein